jgi:hypothetical protein
MGAVYVTAPLGLEILGCSDCLMWYAGKVGEVVPFVREEPDCYLALEPDGFVNMVHKRDARPVWPNVPKA